MKNKFHKLSVAGAVTLMLAAASSSSIAGDDLYGYPAQPSVADRTITISRDTKYVNVTGGEVIKFVTRTKTFTWNFDALNANDEVADLNKIAPADALHHNVKVYIAPDPRYEAGG